MLALLCMLHPKGTFFALPHPTIIGPNRLAPQVEAGKYPKKDPKKVCTFLGHSEGGIFVAHGGLTRMACGTFPAMVEVERQGAEAGALSECSLDSLNVC
jgi:hypothetical protein